jgi:hypothetical protein
MWFNREILFTSGLRLDARQNSTLSAHRDAHPLAHTQARTGIVQRDYELQDAHLAVEADRVLGVANDTTQIIPGHGPMAKKADLKAYRDMLAGVRDKVKPLVAAGKTLAEVQAAKPTQAFDAVWGGGFLKPEQFVAIAYATLGGTKK